MTTIVKELRDALVDAGAKPELADRAAEAVIDHSERDQLATKRDITELRTTSTADLRTGLAELETRIVRELRDQVWKFAGVNAAIAAVVVAAIKLLP